MTCSTSRFVSFCFFSHQKVPSEYSVLSSSFIFPFIWSSSLNMAVLQWKRCPRNLSRYWLFLFAVFVAIHSVHCLRFESALLLKTNVVWTSKKTKKRREIASFISVTMLLFCFVFFFIKWKIFSEFLYCWFSLLVSNVPHSGLVFSLRILLWNERRQWISG